MSLPMSAWRVWVAIEFIASVSYVEWASFFPIAKYRSRQTEPVPAPTEARTPTLANGLAMKSAAFIPRHPDISRRTALQAGAVGLLGLGMNHLNALRAASPTPTAKHPARACIYIFLSGGLAQHESFDLKPKAPAEIRGEFSPVATQTPGMDICEHLPLLAARSRHWAVVRSLGHWSNSHTDGHMIMLTGRSELPPGFTFTSEPRLTDWPSIAATAGYCTPRRSDNLPPAVVLPERLVH